ncbi:uncharacterized protein PITG_14825 [Phytophthora infestans T30-4]|uniref:Uncharacterized protein n=1 Tax=Phytophthora infestans (strain T30-4) TaxID=403677 RepID=D0NP49_PHYIT|nr:uncharacterized protein PITG_14825 [Phytophthora infestans T30-4]EEY62391.1 conserved hypothetical protein [Phytophthora infestans T30-4]|eukprot:XP_002899027.1 conserved hypothetical protein [Phytophthora infestans T30-4]
MTVANTEAPTGGSETSVYMHTGSYGSATRTLNSTYSCSCAAAHVMFVVKTSESERTMLATQLLSGLYVIRLGQTKYTPSSGHGGAESCTPRTWMCAGMLDDDKTTKSNQVHTLDVVVHAAFTVAAAGQVWLALLKTVRCKSDAGRTGGTSLGVVSDTCGDDLPAAKEGSTMRPRRTDGGLSLNSKKLKFLTSPSTIFPEAERVVIEKTRAMEARKRTKCHSNSGTDDAAWLLRALGKKKKKKSKNAAETNAVRTSGTETSAKKTQQKVENERKVGVIGLSMSVQERQQLWRNGSTKKPLDEAAEHTKQQERERQETGFDRVFQEVFGKDQVGQKGADEEEMDSILGAAKASSLGLSTTTASLMATNDGNAKETTETGKRRAPDDVEENSWGFASTENSALSLDDFDAEEDSNNVDSGAFKAGNAAGFERWKAEDAQRAVSDNFVKLNMRKRFKGSSGRAKKRPAYLRARNENSLDEATGEKSTGIAPVVDANGSQQRKLDKSLLADDGVDFIEECLEALAKAEKAHELTNQATDSKSPKQGLEPPRCHHALVCPRRMLWRSTRDWLERHLDLKAATIETFLTLLALETQRERAVKEDRTGLRVTLQPQSMSRCTLQLLDSQAKKLAPRSCVKMLLDAARRKELPHGHVSHRKDGYLSSWTVDFHLHETAQWYARVGGKKEGSATPLATLDAQQEGETNAAAVAAATNERRMLQELRAAQQTGQIQRLTLSQPAFQLQLSWRVDETEEMKTEAAERWTASLYAKHEHLESRQLARLAQLYSALHAAALPAPSPSRPHDENEEDLESKALALETKLVHYFEDEDSDEGEEDERLLHKMLRPLTASLIEAIERDTSSLIQLRLGGNPMEESSAEDREEIMWTSYAVAKVFHGLTTPQLPTRQWRDHVCWRRYSDVAFERIVQIANRVLVENQATASKDLASIEE